MQREYDGCSDEEFKVGATLLQVYPPDDNALKTIKEFVAEYHLTKDEVKIVKNKNGMFLKAKTLLVLSMLHHGDTSNEH